MKNLDLCLIIGIIAVCILISYIYIQKTQENFETKTNNAKNSPADNTMIKMAQNQSNNNNNEAKNNSSINTMNGPINMDDYVKKTVLERAARAAALEYCPVSPNYNPSNYIKKTEIDLQQSCPKMPDLKDYVLKSTIPPIQKCPSCVCPKIKLDAGLCKKCPEPINNCPQPKPCTPEQCKEVIKCEPWQKQVSCPKCPPPQPCPQLPEKVCPALTIPKDNISCPEPKPCPMATPCADGKRRCPEAKCPECTIKKIETLYKDKTTEEIIDDLLESDDPALNEILEKLKNKLNLNESPSPTDISSMKDDLNILRNNKSNVNASFENANNTNHLELKHKEIAPINNQNNSNKFFKIKYAPTPVESRCDGDYCPYDTNLNI